MAIGLGLIGRKCGMTRLFQEDGRSIPATVIQVEPIRVVQKKTVEKDGYDALKVSYGESTAKKLTKPLQGVHKQAGIGPTKGFKEFRLNESDLNQYKLGDEITIDVFSDQKYVDVQGTTKGKGFAGVVKRHNFRTQDATHGNSLSHRAPGSIGQNQTPGRVFKGKKMAGQLGNETCTVQNLELLKVNTERNLLIIKGAIPGHKTSYVIVKPAVKKGN